MSESGRRALSAEINIVLLWTFLWFICQEHPAVCLSWDSRTDVVFIVWRCENRAFSESQKTGHWELLRKIARTWTSSRLCVTQQRLTNAICDYFYSPEPFYTRHITIPTVYMPRLKQTIVNPPRRTRSSHTHTGLSWLVYRLQPIVAKLGHRSLAFSSGRRTVSQ